MTRLTPVFLVLLRLAIGWHFFFEGLDKLNHSEWSSAPYLRESSGPLAQEFRGLAGDPVLLVCDLKPLPPERDTANVPPNQLLPPTLAKEWDNWFARFTSYYDLQGEDLERLRDKYEQRKSQMGSWLKGEGKDADKTITKSAFGVTAEVRQTMPQRLADYKTALQRLAELQQKERKDFTAGANAKLAALKADLMKMRTELLADVNEHTLEMKKILREQLPFDKREQRAVQALRDRNKDKPKEEQGKIVADFQAALEKLPTEKRAQALPHEFLEEEDPSVKAGVALAPVKNEPTLKNFLPEPTAPAWRDWSWLKWDRLQWSDFAVRYGILIVGALLLLGLFTRTACVAGAGFLLLFFLAMPPLPGLPENPKAEGHYLYINKNIIEMLALLALATTTSGRWIGLDGLVHYFSPFRPRERSPKPAREAEPKPAPKRSIPKDLGADTPRPDLAPGNGSAPIPLADEPSKQPASEPPEAATLTITPTHPEDR